MLPDSRQAAGESARRAGAHQRRAAGRGGRPRAGDRARRPGDADRAAAPARAGDADRRQARSRRSPRSSACNEAELVIVDHPLTPVQQRNLEKAWSAKVLDRTGLILEIFGDRAQTKEGRLQVELAHLNYQKGRLVRSWTHLERQRGGFGFLGGPGETQIEADRRQIQTRITPDRGRSSSASSTCAPCTAPSAAACRGRSWRWSATRTPASRRCSTG